MPKRQRHREAFFAENGPGPYACYGCGGALEFADSFDVHHLDENDQNNAPDNLVVMHNGCHIKLHKTGRVVSEETRAKMSIAGSGVTRSLAHRAAIADAHRGIPRSEEVRAKISATQKGRTISTEHKAKIAATLKSRFTPEERERLSAIGKNGAASRWNKEIH